MHELPYLDLTRPSEATRRELYDRMVRLNSQPDPEEPSAPFDPDAAGLTVFHVPEKVLGEAPDRGKAQALIRLFGKLTRT